MMCERECGVYLPKERVKMGPPIYEHINPLFDEHDVYNKFKEIIQNRKYKQNIRKM
jgi:hypothetical protein